MRLEKSIILAFDFRKVRNETLFTPATVDVNLWRQPDQFLLDKMLEVVSKNTEKNMLDIQNPLNSSFITCIPNSWVSNCFPFGPDYTLVAFLSNQFGSSRKFFRLDLLDDDCYGCSLIPSDLTKAGWESLGFDICDDVLSTSLLYTPLEKFSVDVFEKMKDDMKLNANGLFADFYSAEIYSNKNSKLLQEHGSFTPVEVMVKK